MCRRPSTTVPTQSCSAASATSGSRWEQGGQHLHLPPQAPAPAAPPSPWQRHPSAAGTGRTRKPCDVMSLHHQQYGRAGCLSTTRSADVQGVFPHQWSRTCRDLSTKSNMDVQGVFSPQAVYGSTGCLSTTSSMDVQGVFSPQAVWKYRVYSKPIRLRTVFINEEMPDCSDPGSPVSE
jgi:hypothetical protein